MSLSAVDYEMAGRLDIYVCGYFENTKFVSSDSRSLSGDVTHDANAGGNNILFHNEISAKGQISADGKISADATISADGTWRFTDVTGELGLNVNNHRFSLAASWDDFDNDGDQDFYVANDYGCDHFYRNDLLSPPVAKAEQGTAEQGTARQGKAEQGKAGPFVDISDTAHIEDSVTGMSITWGDYDRDGWMDVLVSNMVVLRGESDCVPEQIQARLEGNGKTTNRDAIGARVEVIMGGSGFQSPRQMSQLSLARDSRQPPVATCHVSRRYVQVKVFWSSRASGSTSGWARPTSSSR